MALPQVLPILTASTRKPWLPAFAAFVSLLLPTAMAQAPVTPVPIAANEDPWSMIAEVPAQEPPASPMVPRPEPSEAPGALHDVNLHSGEFTTAVTDLRIRGRGLDLVWARRYRSRSGANTAQGNGWDFSYNLWIQRVGSRVVVHDGNGRADSLVPRAGGVLGANGLARDGAFRTDGSFVVTFADQGTWSFRPLNGSAGGKIETIADRNGNTLRFGYDGAGRLATITDTLGRTVQVAYDATDHIASVADFAGRVVRYTYYAASDTLGGPGDLATVTTPAVTGTGHNDFTAGKTTTYTYARSQPYRELDHNLLTIVDPLGNAWLSNTYSGATATLDFDRVVSQTRGSAGQTIRLVYTQDLGNRAGVPVDATLRAIVNDRVGNVEERFFNDRGEGVLVRRFTGRAVPGVPVTATSNRPSSQLRSTDPAFFDTRYEYRPSGELRRRIRPVGDSTEWVREADLNPTATWRLRGTLRELRRVAGTHLPPGDQAQLVDCYTHAPGFGGSFAFVASHTDARGNVTTHTYDARGNRMQTVHAIATAVEDFTWNASGQLATHTHPRDAAGYRRRDDYTYYGTGPMTGYLQSTIVDAATLQRTTSYQYDAVGHVTRVTDPRGNATDYVVNALDQTVRVTQPAVVNGGLTVRYARLYYFDAGDHVVRVDEQAQDTQQNIVERYTTLWDYEILGQPTRVRSGLTSAPVVVADFAYDANRNRTLTRFGEAVAGTQIGNTITQRFDERGLLFQEIRAQGRPEQSTTQIDYDWNGRESARRTGIESGARVTTQIYDAYDRRVALTDAMGNVTEWHYDANGNPGGDQAPSVPNPFAERVLGELSDVPGAALNLRLAQKTYAYDALDRRISETVELFDPATQVPIGPGRATTTFVWTDASRLASETDGGGHVTTYAYDTAGDRCQTTDARGNSVALVRDANGNVTTRTETDKSGRPDEVFLTTYAYDALDRLIRTTDSSLNGRSADWTLRGSLDLAVDANGTRTKYTYDALDRLVRTARDMNDNGVFTDPSDLRWDRAYDRSSRLTVETDPDGRVQRYTYDALDRLISVQRNDGSLRTTQYNAHGDATVTTDPNGTQVTTVFDLLGRATTRSVARGSGVIGTTTETYAYDGLSRLVRASDDDSLITQTLDSNDQVLRETQQVLPGGPVRTTTATRGVDGDLLSLTYPGGRQLTFVNDALHRATEIRDGALTLVSTAWVGKCRVQQRTLVGGTRTDVTFDGVGTNPPGDFGVRKPVRVAHTRGASSVDDHDALWGKEPDLSQHTDLRSNVTHTLIPDDDRRLRMSTYTPGVSTTYNLDGAGHRLSVTGGPDAGSYTQDALGHYTRTPFDTRSYNADGSLRSTSGAVTIPTPATRSNHEMAFDSLRSQAVMFGGQSASTLLGDTWLWDGTRWTQASPGTSPSPRMRHGMAYCPQRGGVILYGGENSSGIAGGTWLWNGSTWTLISSSGPGPRSGHAMVLDPVRQRIVLFGGRSSATTPLNDTWEFDGFQWQQVFTWQAPQPRAFAGMTWDPQLERALLFGGFDLGSVIFNDVWYYDGAQAIWQQLSVFSPSSPAPRLSRYVYDPGVGGTVLFGGDNGAQVFGDMWVWNSFFQTWTQRSPTTLPSPRTAFSMERDPVRDTLVLFGPGETWLWTNDNWVRYSPTTQQTLFDFSYDYRGQIVSGRNWVTGVTVTYAYDCLGRKLQRTENGTTTRHYWFGGHELEEQTGSGVTAATYVHDASCDAPLLMRRGGQDYALLTDPSGNVTKLVSSAGAVVEQYTYADFGVVTIRDGVGNVRTRSAVGNGFLFAGMRYDDVLRLYVGGAEAYDPRTAASIGPVGDPKGKPHDRNPWLLDHGNRTGSLSLMQLRDLIHLPPPDFFCGYPGHGGQASPDGDPVGWEVFADGVGQGLEGERTPWMDYEAAPGPVGGANIVVRYYATKEDLEKAKAKKGGRKGGKKQDKNPEAPNAPDVPSYDSSFYEYVDGKLKRRGVRRPRTFECGEHYQWWMENQFR